MRKAFLIFLLGFIHFEAVKGQSSSDFGMDSLFVLSDTTETLSFNDFYKMVLAFHPIVQQADLLSEQARQEIRLARGGFDPKLKANWDLKEFKDTRYYNILNTTLEIPTWLPIDAKVTFDRNLGDQDGRFLNDERSIPDDDDNEQLSFGLSFDLGAGLLIDERRAAFRKAQIFSDMAEAERIKEINKILLTAVKDYWNWYFSYYNFRLFNRSVIIAQDIFDRVKLNYELGEASVIDTVQAKITLQGRISDTQQARIDYLRSSFILSNHLWGQGGLPLDLREGTAPPPIPDFANTLTEEELVNLLKAAESNHPELRKLDFKLDQLQIENRLFKEYLKPEVNFDYSIIDQPITTQGETDGLTFEDNFKFGLNFSYPLFLRKERAKIQKNELKSTETVFERNYRRQQILTEVNGNYARIINSAVILDQQQQMAEGYRRLVEAEFLNLRNGESDLFKINAQQEKYIESYSKFLKTRTTLEKSKAELYWAAGIENLNLN
ncbi:MAG: TolC family protein [Bacteroidota bacterium]